MAIANDNCTLLGPCQPVILVSPMLPERAALLLAVLAPDFPVDKRNFTAEMSLMNSLVSFRALGRRQLIFFAPIGVQ